MACPGSLLLSMGRRRLLRRMLGLGVLPTGGDIPERRLLAIAGPIALFTDGVPAGFVLPMIVALTHHETFLGPNDLSPDRKPALKKALRNNRRAKCPMPDVSNLARK